MFDFIFSQISLYLSIILVLFVPGAFLILASRMYKNFSPLELFVLIFGFSIGITDFLVILLGRSPLSISRVSLISGIIIFSSICFAIFLYHRKKSKEVILFSINDDKISKHSTILIVLLLFLTIFIKTVYLKDAIFPTSTDLGHHMYWTKQIATTGQLPTYAKAEITYDYTMGRPTPIADFIIGEHLPFASIAIISNANVVSSFAVLILFLIHIMSVLTIFVLTRALFVKSEYKNVISIITLLLVGPLWAIASPQAKFISGGVIGNDIGNFLIPLAILLFLKAFRETMSNILAAAIFIGLTMAYTHHLSTFVFIFLSIFTLIFYTILNYKNILTDIKGWVKLFITPEVLSILAFGLIFVFLLYMPTYLNTSAIDTAVGAPSKATRAGLTLDQLKSTAGEARFAFAIFGIIFLFFARKLGKYNQAFLIGWIFALSIMSLRPDWLFVNIPSNRVASYIVFPMAIIASYILVKLLTMLKSKTTNFISPSLLLITFFIIMSFIATSGLYDNAMSLNEKNGTSEALQTYAASKYLATKASDTDMVLKDHNYLSGDSWIKLFFMKDYNFPLSRGFFKRYEDETKTREQCTNLMISSPSDTEAKLCYIGTKTNFIMIDPTIDRTQFERLNNFWQIYAADNVGIFYKAN